MTILGAAGVIMFFAIWPITLILGLAFNWYIAVSVFMNIAVYSLIATFGAAIYLELLDRWGLRQLNDDTTGDTD